MLRQSTITRKENYLNRVELAQTIYKEHKHEGLTDKWIWKTHVKPVLFVGYETFLNYMKVSLGLEWKKLEEMRNERAQEQESKNQQA